MAEAAQARALTKVYGAGSAAVRALDAVDVDLHGGQFTAIMGPSGSGKSTLMHLLAGLDAPTSGTVTIGDIDLSTLNDSSLTELRRDRVGFVFQAFNLVPTLTAEENILLPLAIAGRKPDAEWYDTVIDTVGLRDRLTHKPSELSGGQQQRVACARAMVTRPDIIFADEPTGNLDSVASTEVLEFLRHSVDEFGQTIVMVTHEATAASYADRAVFLADGRIIADTTHTNAEDLLNTMARLYPSAGSVSTLEDPLPLDESDDEAAPTHVPAPSRPDDHQARDEAENARVGEVGAVEPGTGEAAEGGGEGEGVPLFVDGGTAPARSGGVVDDESEAELTIPRRALN